MKKQSNIIKDCCFFCRVSMVFIGAFDLSDTPKDAGISSQFHRRRKKLTYKMHQRWGKVRQMGSIMLINMGKWSKFLNWEKKGRVGSRWLICFCNFWSPTCENLPHPTLQAFLQCIGLISWICWWMFQNVGPFFFRQRNENKIRCKNEYGNLSSKMRNIGNLLENPFFQSCNPALFLWIVVGITILKFFLLKRTHTLLALPLGILSPKLESI